MSEIEEHSDEVAARAWDHARGLALATSLADLTLRELAEKIGNTWRYVHADQGMRKILPLSWDELRSLHGLGRLKRALLLEYVTEAANGLTGTVLQGGGEAQVRAAMNLDIPTALAGLGVAHATPLELMTLSARARNFLQREGLRNLGEILDFLEDTNLPSLQGREGVGNKTARELLGILFAVTSGRADLVRQYLPLRMSGCGLCFSAAAATILRAETPEDREALAHRLEHGDTLKEAAEHSGRTRARVGQIVGHFLEAINTVLTHFPEEKHAFWEAWQRCEPLEDLLGGELDGEGRRTVAAVLSRIFASSPEGRAIIEHRQNIFDQWWEDVRRNPDFYLGGLRIGRFVREMGDPRLLVPFLDYLEESKRADICRTSGTAVSKRRPLKRVVKAVVDASDRAMSPTELLARFNERGLFTGLADVRFENKLNAWVRSGEIPSSKIKLDSDIFGDRGIEL